MMAHKVRQDKKELNALPCGNPSFISNEPRNYQVVCTSKDWHFGIAFQKMAVGET
jgi:hypothetical protein